MKFALCAAISMLLMVSPSSEVTKCRSLYFSEPSEEKALSLQKTAAEISNNDGLKLAYSGVAVAMLAEYAFNPFSKLNRFNEGTAQIEQAIKLAPKNPEIRFLRLGVQTNAPAFLGYSSDQQEDVKLIVASLVNDTFTDDPNYKKKVLNYLQNKAPLSNEQQQKISVLR